MPHNDGIEPREQRRENNFGNTIVPLTEEVAKEENEVPQQIVYGIPELSLELTESNFESRKVFCRAYAIRNFFRK